MSAKPLLAKKLDADRPTACRLDDHLARTHEAARRILTLTGAAQLDALGLPIAEFADRFERLVLAAAVLHDLGKASDQFQTMIHGIGPSPQRVRHEWVTYVILGQPAWREWLSPALSSADDYDLLRWCVANHHLKDADRIVSDGAGPDIRLLQSHEDFRTVLRTIAECLGLGPPPSLADKMLSADAVVRDSALVHAPWEEDEADRPTKRLLAAAKATLIAADVAASATAQHDVPLDWVDRSLAVTPTRAEYDKLVADKLTEKSPTAKLLQFQKDGGASTARVTFVKAGCGSGKTLLAYHWAARRAPVRRLYLCYPTTGTATEGFGDYLTDDQGRVKAAARLFHSRAKVDLTRILGVSYEEDDEAAKLASLAAWPTPVVVATVDTVLGLIQSQRRGVYAWPAMCQAAFCFDEIHSYDNRLFGALLCFLKEVPGVPMLLMTASLPEARRLAIENVLKRQGERMESVPGPADLEVAPRYERLHTDDVARTVRDHLDGGGKVLWVCNTVGRAMRAYEGLADRGPMLYHSRYRYADRTDRHADAMAAFDLKRNAGPALVIATQVAEMSLDLSATLLVTDLAPIPALIQRLGRLNRRAGAGNTRTMPFVVVTPDGDERSRWLPYGTKPDEYGDWPATTRAWLERLGDGPLSQKDLADAWDSASDLAVRFPRDSAWLDRRTSVPLAVREGSPGISVLLESDRTAAADRNRFVEAVLPMNQPPSKDWEAEPRVRGVAVAAADAITYSRLRGGAWRK